MEPASVCRAANKALLQTSSTESLGRTWRTSATQAIASSIAEESEATERDATDSVLDPEHGAGIAAEENSAHEADDTMNHTVSRAPRWRGPRHDYLKHYWQHFNSSEPMFFDNLTVAVDGGFSRVPELWTPLRYLWVLVMVVSIALNLWYLFDNDIHWILNTPWWVTGDDDNWLDMFLFTGWIMDHIVYWKSDFRFGPRHICAFLDLGLYAILISRTLRHFCIAKGCCRCSRRAQKPDDELKKWHSVARFYWHLLPMFATLNAMSMLYFVIPSVFVADLCDWLTLLADPNSRNVKWPFARFVASRIIFLIGGIDAFLIKFRVAAQLYAIPDSTGSTTALRIVVGSAAFMNQILGVVNLRWASQRRLSNFIFAGPSGYMSEAKLAKRRTWNAMISRQIWRRFQGDRRFHAIMMSFSDWDLQFLTLLEDAEVASIPDEDACHTCTKSTQ
jgi:hypothetical protein